MGEVTAKRRIKVATRDHITISLLHLRLHRKSLSYIVIILFSLVVAASVTMVVVVGATQPSVESEWEVTDLRWGTVSCQNIETRKTKKFTPKKYTLFKIRIGNYTLSMQKSKLWRVRVGDYIILRDYGWLCRGNHFVRVSQKYTDLEVKSNGISYSKAENKSSY